MIGIYQNLSWYKENKLPVMQELFSADLEAIHALSEYLLRKYNGRVKYNHEGFEIPAKECHLLTTVNWNLHFAFYDFNGDYIGICIVFEVVYKGFKQAFYEQQKGQKINCPWDLEPKISSKAFKIDRIKKAA